MSSIYRKGRDGYFYYQTYILNEDTGKKDKKIFHSLGTKDKKVAKEKQLIFDSQYNSKLATKKSRISNNFLVYPKIVVGSLVVILAIITNGIISSQRKIMEQENVLMKNRKILAENRALNKKINSLKDSLRLLKSNFSYNETKFNGPESESTYLPSLSQPKIDSTLYSIIKVERLSNKFDQCKVYASVQTNYSDKTLREICNHIKNKYSKFSNIVICVYKSFGITEKDLAENPTKIKDQINEQAWLAMYTYNPVEGSYFDGSPNDYLGDKPQ